MDKPFPKEFVGFIYEKNGQLFYGLEKSGKAAERWKKLVDAGCEVIYMPDLEEDSEIKVFLVRAAYYADNVWPILHRQQANP
ncbi:MAG: hypothetical protein CO141_03275 [Candidatus Moranbacteria bacterium CG_4_9_14_3_um_filter_42_9]|nr:MAG: hypothetical protein CO141_03275 [Candidatus Moranbacteria bacterium CG_4_9_14_3_um_filter_42_9]